MMASRGRAKHLPQRNENLFLPPLIKGLGFDVGKAHSGLPVDFPLPLAFANSCSISFHFTTMANENVFDRGAYTSTQRAGLPLKLIS